MHTRLATALAAVVLTITAAPALADDPAPATPTADADVVTAVESALAQARVADPASKRSTCLADASAEAAMSRLKSGEWTYDVKKIAAACHVLKVVAVRDYSASTPDDIAHRLVDSAPITQTIDSPYVSRHAASSFRLDPDVQTATVLLVAEPRHQAAFAPAATRGINRAFVTARTAKPKLSHSPCLSKAAHAWSKERVATAGKTPGRREVTTKACKMRVLGLSLFETRGSTKKIIAKVRTSTVFRGYSDRRTPVTYAAAVYVDKISGVKQVIFFAGQPK